jgi:Flp pilus assembly protein TadD
MHLRVSDHSHRAILGAICFLSLHILSPLAPSLLWGVDALSYGTWPWFILGSGVAVLVSIHISDKVLDRCRSIVVRLASPWIAPLILLLLALALPSALHFLGDGYLLIRELDSGAWDTLSRTDRAPLTFWMLTRLHHVALAMGNNAESVYRTVSVISGLGYAFLVPLVASRLSSDGRRQTCIVLSLLTAGYLQLFLGYVENYAPLYPGMLLLILSLVNSLTRQGPLWPAALTLGLLCALHFSTVTLFPGLLYAAYVRRSERGIQQSLSEIVLFPVSTLIILWLIDFDVISYLSEVRDHTLPLAVGAPKIAAYNIWSLLHIADIINVLLLTAPIAVIVLLTTPLRSLMRDDMSRMLSAICVGPLLFLIIANPEIGAFRDWDVLSMAALPLTVFAAYGWSAEPPTAYTKGWVIGAAALHTFLWIGTNASADLAEARYQAHLHHAPLSASAKVYGWETLGTVQRVRDDHEAAAISYGNALEADPNHYRLWLLQGNAYQQTGQTKKAKQAYLRVLQLRPETSEAHSNLGALYVLNGQYESAFEHLDKATRLTPGYAAAWMNRGVALANTGRTTDAIGNLKKAIELDSSYRNAYKNLSKLYATIGKQDSARYYGARAKNERSTP